eukprot:CFRG2656T1
MVKVYATEKESEAAAQVAVKAGFIGGVKWALFSAGALSLGHTYVPTIRQVTIPGKVFVVLAASLIGGMTHGERAMADFGEVMREYRNAESEQKLDEQLEAARTKAIIT